MSTVQEINSVEQLQHYRLLWRWHLDRTPEANFVQSLTWLETYWRHYGRGGKLRVLVVSADDEPVGILPLVVDTEPTRLGPIRVLTYPLGNWGTFYGPLGSNPTATLLAGLGHIRRTERDWDMMELRWVDFERTDRGRLRSALSWHRLKAKASKWADVSLVETTGSWDRYLSDRSDRWRNNYRRCEKKLACQGEVRLVRYRPAGSAQSDDDPRWDLYDICEQLAARSWQGSSASGTTLSHASVRPFLRDMHARAVCAGAVDLNLLYVGATPVAFAYNYHLEGYVSGLRSGFDPAVSRDGAGTVLMGRMIRDSFERGDRTVDLGSGYLEAKRSWQTSIVASYRYSHYPTGTLRPQVLRLRRWLRERHINAGDVKNMPAATD